MSLSPDGRYLLTKAGGFAKVWALPRGHLVTLLRGRPTRVESVGLAVIDVVAFSPDSRYVATSS